MVDLSGFSVMIKKLRTECHLTQDELASKLGLTRSTIGMYETGKREPDFETLEAIADFFNVNFNYLLGRESKDVFLRIKKAMEYTKVDKYTLMKKIYSVPDQFENWENNISNSYLEYLPKISKALNIPEEYFWGNMRIGELTPDVYRSGAIDNLPNDIRAAARGMMELSDEDKEMAINMINRLSERGKKMEDN